MRVCEYLIWLKATFLVLRVSIFRFLLWWIVVNLLNFWIIDDSDFQCSYSDWFPFNTTELFPLCLRLVEFKCILYIYFSIFLFFAYRVLLQFFFFIAYTPWVSQKIYDIFKSRMQNCGNCFVGTGDREKVAKNWSEKYILPARQKFRCHQREPSTPAVFLVFCSL